MIFLFFSGNYRFFGVLWTKKFPQTWLSGKLSKKVPSLRPSARELFLIIFPRVKSSGTFLSIIPLKIDNCPQKTKKSPLKGTYRSNFHNFPDIKMPGSHRGHLKKIIARRVFILELITIKSKNGHCSFQNWASKLACFHFSNFVKFRDFSEIFKTSLLKVAQNSATTNTFLLLLFILYSCLKTESDHLKRKKCVFSLFVTFIDHV